jgi:hypothetical protein
LEKENMMRWPDNVAYLDMLEHLAVAGNPEDCFIVGLTLVFTRHQTKQGLVYLDQAAASAHKAAAYILGLLLYTLEYGANLANWHIGQVEGSVGHSKVAAEQTNQEFR